MADFTAPTSDLEKPVSSAENGFVAPSSDIAASKSDGKRDFAAEWANAKTASDRLALMGNWINDRKQQIAAMTVKSIPAAIPNPYVRAAVAPVTQAAGDVIEGQPVTMGKEVAAAIKFLPGAKSGQAASNALRFFGADAIANEAQSLIDQGKFADASQLAQSAKNAIGAAATVAVLDTGGRSKSETARQRREQPLIDTLQDAHDKGLAVNTTLYNPNAVNKAATSIAGQSNVEKQMSAINAPKVDEMIRGHFGFAPDQPITPQAFTVARFKAAEPYRALSNLSPAAKAEVENWQKLTAEASDAASVVRTTTDRAARIKAREEAKLAQQQADASYRKLEGIAASAGVPEMAPALKDARISIAELHAGEKAFKMSVGKNADPLVFGEMYSAGVPLRGDLLTIGRLAEAMPQVLGDPTKASVLTDMTRRGGLSLVGGGLGSVAGPVGAVTGAAISQAVPSIASKLATNPLFQKANLLPRYGTQDVSAPVNMLQFTQRL